MDDQNYKLAAAIVGETYVKQAQQAKHQREAEIRVLLSQRSIPEVGWDDVTINLLLTELSLMDSNNFKHNIGAGEREGRVYSEMVAKRHFHLTHGIGRSGEIAVVQPKACGSSLMLKLASSMALQAIKLSGVKCVTSCIVLPLATGMALVMSLIALKSKNPDAKYVIWNRIDQKTCLKSIITAGLEPIVIENLLENDELRTNIADMEKAIEEKGKENILCAISTTSCFAPRVPDKVVEIAKLCKKYDIGHIINNAYGLQSTKITSVIDEACRSGRVDGFVQSTDKNFLVPVGGSIVATNQESFVHTISQSYPGRASASPIVDLFITLLTMGKAGYQSLLKERKENFDYLKSKMEEIAVKYNEKLLKTPHNPISLGITLDSFGNDVTYLGSMLFARCCSGSRVVGNNETKQIGKLKFTNYGSHSDIYPHKYLTVACAIGMKKDEIDAFIERVDKVFFECKKKHVEKSESKVVTTV